MNSINTTDIAVAPSPSADINGVTLIYMCHLFGFLKEWLQEGGVSVDSAMIYDTDTLVQKERMFSASDCSKYQWWLITGYGDCVIALWCMKRIPSRLLDLPNAWQPTSWLRWEPAAAVLTIL